MVWESSHSPLYVAVENFNNNQPRKPDCGQPERPPAQNGTPCAQPCEEAAPERCHSAGTHQCAQCRQAQRGNSLQTLFSDKDTLLIAALLVILIHEKADMKIIIAVGIILLM